MEAYFSDIRTKIVDRLDRAEKSLKIAMAWFTNDVLFHLLVDKAAGGLEISLLISSSETNFNRPSGLAFDALERKGAKIRVLRSQDGYQFMHHKFAVVDEKEVITGSYNWSNNAHTNYENIVILTDPKIARDYSLQFDRLFTHDNASPMEGFRTTDQVIRANAAQEVDSNLSALARLFGEEVSKAMAQADNLHLGIRMNIIDGMIKRYSAVGAARKLSNDPEQSGFIKLVTVNRADLTFEYLTARREFSPLFDPVTIKNAKNKLRPYIGNAVDSI
jgi:hypothetical protein